MGKKKIHQPCDKFFKKGLSYSYVAREFFDIYLPPQLKEIMNFDTLKLEKTSFISDKFKLSEADVLYSAKLTDDAPLYIYFLLEHQSTVDAEMAFRLLCYVIEIMKKHVDTQTMPLPLVYPLVIYTGDEEWTVSRDFFDLFGSQSVLARSLFLNPFPILDVCRMEQQELRQHIFSGVMFYVFKNRIKHQAESFVQELLQWVETAHAQGGEKWAQDVLEFTVMELDISAQIWENGAQCVLANQELRSNTMTLAQQWMQQGMQQGIAQGKAEGISVAQQRIAQKMLRMGESLDYVQAITDLSLNVLQDLKTTCVA